MAGAGDVERDARVTADVPPHEAVAPDEEMKRAHREVAEEVLARKQAILDERFNGKVQTMDALLKEMAADCDLSDCPTVFDYAWDEATQQFLETKPRKVEFK